MDPCQLLVSFPLRGLFGRRLARQGSEGQCFFFMLDLSPHSHVVSLDTKLTLQSFSLYISIIKHRRKNSRVRLSVRAG